MEVASDYEGYPVIAFDVRELLAVPRDDEINEDVLTGVAHHRRLRPAIRAQRRDRHQTIVIEDIDRFVFHPPISQPLESGSLLGRDAHALPVKFINRNRMIGFLSRRSDLHSRADAWLCCELAAKNFVVGHDVASCQSVRLFAGSGLWPLLKPYALLPNDMASDDGDDSPRAEGRGQWNTLPCRY